MNIPLVLAEYVCCMILTRGLTKCRPQGKAAVLMLLPYSLLLILPSSVFYLHDLFGEVSALLALSLLETAGWTVTLRAAWKKSWQWSLITGAMVVFLYGITDEMGGFFLTRNFDLKNPAGLAAYMGSSILGILFFGSLVAMLLAKCRLSEAYNGFLEQETSFRGWKAVIILLPYLKILCVEAVNERLILNNSNPMISLLFLLLVLGVLNYALQSDAQKKQLGQQQVSLEQQKLYIRNLESVQQDVRIFRHDFKNRMAGIRLRADEGDLEAVQEFLAEVTGDFEKKVGEKIFQASQMGNIQIMELKGLLAVKTMEMQKRKISFYLEAAVPVTSADLSAADLCRAVGILLDNAMEAAEEFRLCGKHPEEGEDHSAVKAIFFQDASGLSVIVSNPVREEADLSRIWEEGYSTRGAGRGTGLTSLRRIVEAGSNISLRTSWDHGIFTQELQIGTGVNGK